MSSPLMMGRLFLSLGLLAASIAVADTITLDGRVIEDAEMLGVAETGVQYKTADGLVILPWAELNQFQRTAVTTRYAEQLENLRTRALWVEGTVFENTRDGVVIQISLDLKAGNDVADETPKVTEWKNGGEVAKGLVIIKDLKDSAVKKPGDPVEGIFYKVGTFTYEVGGFNLIKEIGLLTSAKPEWAVEREWTNLGGNKIRARLIAVKDGKCLLDAAGKSYPYPIDQLSEADRALISEFEKQARAIPLP
ncbi:MAG: hypothetical protein KDM63_05865 [Verrucomicrobiae bacterium]|nr:hypothetical protein [Verrucomicrobiae bacterium]